MSSLLVSFPFTYVPGWEGGLWNRARHAHMVPDVRCPVKAAMGLLAQHAPEMGGLPWAKTNGLSEHRGFTVKKLTEPCRAALVFYPEDKKSTPSIEKGSNFLKM